MADISQMRRARPRPCGARWEYSIPCAYVQAFCGRRFWVCVPNTNSRGCASPFRGFATPTNKKPTSNSSKPNPKGSRAGRGGDEGGGRGQWEMIRACACGAKFSRRSNTNSRGYASPVRFFNISTTQKGYPNGYPFCVVEK